MNFLFYGNVKSAKDLCKKKLFKLAVPNRKKTNVKGLAVSIG